jgi:hypothetical protein
VVSTRKSVDSSTALRKGKDLSRVDWSQLLLNSGIQVFDITVGIIFPGTAPLSTTASRVMLIGGLEVSHQLKARQTINGQQG